jgi:MYXO-CTERM domain-containing protein
MPIRRIALASVLLAACLVGHDDDVATTELSLSHAPAPDLERPRGSYLLIPPELELSAEVAESIIENSAQPRLIYMNRHGGTYVPGHNNSSTNHSSIVSQTSYVPPWQVSDANWNYVVDCVADLFAPFNVIVTDVDPGSTPHVESVVAGRPQHIGMQAGVGGVSPFRNDCGMIERSIVFTFAEVYGTAYRAICETAAQEIAHSYGLDHKYLCADPMTYLSGCGAKTFQDQDARCGEYSARNCRCVGPTMNSVRMLTERLGPSDPDLWPPTVRIDQPANGAQVAAGFQVVASSDSSLLRVELFIDGALTDSRQSPPWAFDTPATLAAGSRQIEVRAHGASGEASDSITVLVLAGDGPDGPDGPIGPDPGGPGAPCLGGEDCDSGMCASSGGDSYCTSLCDPTAVDACPAGLECVATGGGEHVCWPGAGADGPDSVSGGCAAGGGGGPAALWLLAAALALAARRRTAHAPRP